MTLDRGTGSPTSARFDRDARYACEDEIGRGGLGRVVRATDRKLGRQVAIKMLLRGDAELRTRFEREAKLAARLEHPAIVTVHDAGTAVDGAPYYAMKLVSGRSLRDAIDATSHYRERIALLPHVVNVAEAVGYAHEHGIIHRDLKPSNVVIGAFGETVVVDWGLAKELWRDDEELADAPFDDEAPGLTRAGAVLGTPAYMPPEQARGGAVDTTADVYAIGAMLYHLLSGELPYEGSGSREVIDRLLEGPPLALEEVEPRVAPDLAAIVRRAMAREPDDRYINAGELAADLSRFRAGELVGARDYPAVERAWRWARRHSRLLGYAGAALLAGAVAFTISEPGSMAPSCGVPSSAFRGTWDDAVKAEVRAAAGSSYDQFAVVVDDYVSRWMAMHREACEATHVVGSQSPYALSLQMQCLDERRSSLRAFTRAVAAAEVVPAAVDLPPVETCADVEALSQLQPLPDDPGKRARLADARAILDRARAVRMLGRLGEASAVASEAVAEARGQKHAPLLAEALLEHAMTLELRGDDEAALAAFLETARVAAEAGDDRTIARAWFGAFAVVADRRGDAAAARAMVPIVDAAAARVSDDSDLQARYRALIAGHEPK